MNKENCSRHLQRKLIPDDGVSFAESPMPGRDFDDDAELRPPGEAAYVPDHELNTERGDRRRGSPRPGYLGEDGLATECRSRGASIPPGRMKWRFFESR